MARARQDWETFRKPESFSSDRTSVKRISLRVLGEVLQIGTDLACGRFFAKIFSQTIGRVMRNGPGRPVPREMTNRIVAPK
jgi:hypothetical protein